MKQNRKILTLGEERITGEDSVIRFKIPRLYDIESLYLTAAYQENITTIRGTIRQTARYDFLRRLRVIANGQSVLFDCGGYEAAVLGILDRKLPLPITALSPVGTTGVNSWNTPASNGVGLQNIVTALPIDFSSLDYVRPKDTALRTAGLQSLELEARIGLLTDQYQSTTGASSIVGGTLQLCGVMLDEQQDVEGRKTKPLFQRRRYHLTPADILQAAVANQYRVPLPNGVLVKNIVVIARDQNATNNRAANITRIRVQQEDAVWCDLTSADLQRITANFTVVDSTATVRCINFGNTHGMMGKVTDCLDLRSAKPAQLVYDLSAVANTRVDVVVDALVPIA